MSFRRIATTLATIAVLVPAGAARTQMTAGWNPAQLQVTRAELQDLLTRFESAAGSDAYSRDLRERARLEADLVRNRLAEGDFQIGDQVALVVEGEEALTSTFLVTQGRALQLPVIGDVPLTGVLRSELESHLAQHLGRYIRNPTVRARSLIRISVTGAVGNPGFYVVPTEQLVTDALMMAGGPTATANLRAVAIERGDRRIWQGETLQRAITEGRTLDQISLRAGDRIVVPAQSTERTTRVLTVLGTVSTLTYLVIRVFDILGTRGS